MTVETNYDFAFTTPSDWLKNLEPVFQSMRSKTKPSCSLLQGILIISSRCFILLWLVRVIILVLVFRNLFENRPKDVKPNQTKLLNLDEIQLQTDFK